ncbi:MAG: hypothetical protein O3A20_05775 [Planctomycetota bacterium]|nr:hypothetical protein [Planctomycetota bacterium]
MLLLLAAQSGSVTDDFDAGTNPNGWNFGFADVLELSGGNPNGWLHNDTLDTFYPILVSGPAAGAPWTGDYAAAGVTFISLDGQTLHTDFPVAGGFDLSLLLRDDKGTVNVDDDDYAYFVADEIPLPGNGWKHFEIPVPSRSSVAVPPGWTGGWSGNGDHFRPGVSWQDLMANVTTVEVWWSDPTRFAIFQNWGVGVDNLTLEYGSGLALRAPVPGTAGSLNQFSAENAQPGEYVAFAGSLSTGAATGRCNGRSFMTGLGQPRLLGSAVANGAGVADLSLFVPGSLSGSTVQLQALNRSRCELSGVLAVTLL